MLWVEMLFPFPTSRAAFVVVVVVGWGAVSGTNERIATWLILPVVIRSSQRLSHACLSINLLL